MSSDAPNAGASLQAARLGGSTPLRSIVTRAKTAAELEQEIEHDLQELAAEVASKPNK